MVGAAVGCEAHLGDSGLQLEAALLRAKDTYDYLGVLVVDVALLGCLLDGHVLLKQRDQLEPVLVAHLHVLALADRVLVLRQRGL